MIEEELLYDGLGRKTELRKKMIGKGVVKMHDMNAETVSEITDTVQTGI